MTLLIKQSESTAARRRLLFVLVDITDGFTKETGLSSGFTVYISKAGGTPASSAGSITELNATNAPGQYYYEFTTGEIDTLGFIAISIRHANCRDVDGEVQVVAFDPYASADLGLSEISDIKTKTDGLNFDGNNVLADVMAMNADVITASAFAQAAADKVWATVAKVITGGVLTTPNDYKATGFSTHNAAAIWAEAVKVITGGVLTTPADYKADVSALALEATLNALNNLSSSEIQTVLETNDLDHLIQVAAGVENPTVDSYIDQILNKNGSQTFDPTTDSLEAIRDRGDDAWTTGGAGGIDAIINVIPSIPKNIDLSNTKTVRIALYIIDSIDDLPTTAEITPGTIKIQRSADGGTSWITIVNDEACLEYAGCIYYDEVFDSGSGYVSADMIQIIFKGQKVTIAANDIEIADVTNGMVFTTRIDSGLSGGGPSAADIADAVWNELISGHTGGTTFGGKNQKVVPSETLADYKANVSGVATESNATTNKNSVITEVNANETKIDALNNISAAEVNTEVDSALNTAIPASPVANSINERIKQIDENPNTYKATGFSTSGALTTHDGKLDTVDANVDLILEDTATTIPGLIAALNNLSSDNVGDAVWDEIMSGHVSAGSAGEQFRRLLALLGKHQVIDDWTWDGNDNQLTCIVYLYDTKVNANAHVKGSGLQTGGIGQYTQTITFDVNERPDLKKVVEDS